MQRKIYALKEYQSMRTDLLDRVKRTLDIRNLMKITMSNHKWVRRVINKYAKPYKKETDTKKLLKKRTWGKFDRCKIYCFSNNT